MSTGPHERVDADAGSGQVDDRSCVEWNDGRARGGAPRRTASPISGASTPSWTVIAEIVALGSSSTSSRKWSRRKVRPVTVPARARRPAATSVERRRVDGRVGRRRTPTSRSSRGTVRRTRRPGRCHTSAAAAVLRDPAVVHHDDAVGERERLVVVVGDEHDVIPSCVNSARSSPTSRSRSARSSAPSGSSSIKSRGCGRKRAGEGDALLLATRQLRRPAGARTRRARRGRASRVRGRRRPRGESLHAEPERDVAEHVAVREERVVLEHEAEAAPVRSGPRRGRRRPSDTSPSRRAAGRRWRGAVCSCRSARAEDRDDLAVGDREVDAGRARSTPS